MSAVSGGGRRGHHHCLAGGVEWLESRLLMAATSWTGGTENATTFVALNPTATFLRTNSDPGATSAAAIQLSLLGISPRMRIRLGEVGDYKYSPAEPENAVTTIGIFSSSSMLLPSNNLVRVPNSVPSGLPAITTANTAMGSLSTG